MRPISFWKLKHAEAYTKLKKITPPKGPPPSRPPPSRDAGMLHVHWKKARAEWWAEQCLLREMEWLSARCKYYSERIKELEQMPRSLKMLHFPVV